MLSKDQYEFFTSFPSSYRQEAYRTWRNASELGNSVVSGPAKFHRRQPNDMLASS